MNKLKSRKLWVIIAMLAPSIMQALGIDINLFHAVLSDAGEQIAIAANSGGVPNGTDPLMYVAGIAYICIQGILDGKDKDKDKLRERNSTA